jgi:hypothetical protein
MPNRVLDASSFLFGAIGSVPQGESISLFG